MEKINYCDCGAKLQLDKMLSIIDAYDNKLMVRNRYYCPECQEEYEINEEVDKVPVFVNIHMKAFENWQEGKVADVWHDEKGILCIKYNSGKWWHYQLKFESRFRLEWW